MSVKSSLALLVLLTPLFVAAQCPYDLDGDGIVNPGSGDHVLHFGQFGSDAPNTDHNNNGVTDILDLLEFSLHKGQDCPTTPPTETDLVLGLLVDVEHVHTADLMNGNEVLPAGAITYRIYAQLNTADATILSLFGNADDPMSIQTSTSFWSSDGFNHDGYAIDDTWLLAGLFPGLLYESYFTFGPDPAQHTQLPVGTGVWLAPTDVDASLTGGNALVFDSFEGAGYFNTFQPYSTAETDVRFIGQFTVIDGGSLSGQINLEVVQGDGLYNADAHHRALGLTFSSENLTEVGCMDPEAENYDPAAVFDDGSCTYFGDLNNDGVVDTSDILILLGDMGCFTCGDSDLDGDGVTGSADVLIILGLL